MVVFMDVNKMAVHQLDQRILLIKRTTNNIEVLFCPMFNDIQCSPTSERSVLCINFPHTSPACPSGKISIKMNASTELWWNDTDSKDLSTHRKTCLSDTLPTINLTWAFPIASGYPP